MLRALWLYKIISIAWILLANYNFRFGTSFVVAVEGLRWRKAVGSKQVFVFDVTLSFLCYERQAFDFNHTDVKLRVFSKCAYLITVNFDVKGWRRSLHEASIRKKSKPTIS